MKKLPEDNGNFATEYGQDRTALRDAVRSHFKTEIGIEHERLAVLGWDESYIAAAINVYLDHRCDLHTHTVGIIAINAYLQALSEGKTPDEAYDLAMKVQSVMPSADEKSSTVEVDEALIQATAIASSSNFGVNPPADDGRTLPLDGGVFGSTAQSHETDGSTLVGANTRYRIQTAFLFAPTSESEAATLPKPVSINDLPPIVGPQIVATPAVPVVNVHKLTDSEIADRVRACPEVLRKEKVREQYIGGATVVYELLLKRGDVPAEAMKLVRLFCQQRALGADDQLAIKVIRGLVPPIEEPAEDPAVAVAIAQERLDVRWKVLAALGILALAGTCIGSAVYFTSSSSSDSQGDAQVQPSNR